MRVLLVVRFVAFPQHKNCIRCKPEFSKSHNPLSGHPQTLATMASIICSASQGGCRISAVPDAWIKGSGLQGSSPGLSDGFDAL